MGTERQREEFKRRAELETGTVAAAQQPAVWRDEKRDFGNSTSSKSTSLWEIQGQPRSVLARLHILAPSSAQDSSTSVFAVQETSHSPRVICQWPPAKVLFFSAARTFKESELQELLHKKAPLVSLPLPAGPEIIYFNQACGPPVSINTLSTACICIQRAHMVLRKLCTYYTSNAVMLCGCIYSTNCFPVFGSTFRCTAQR